MFIDHLYFFSVFGFIGFTLKMSLFSHLFRKKTILNMMNNKNVENIFI